MIIRQDGTVHSPYVWDNDAGKRIQKRKAEIEKLEAEIMEKKADVALKEKEYLKFYRTRAILKSDKSQFRQLN